MPRRPRIIVPNTPQHIIQRGNNRQACFYADEDYQFYLEWLKFHADKLGVEVHAYVLMTNHVHLLVSTEKTDAIGALMKALGQRYVQYINKTYKRSGTLWEGRFRSCPIEAEAYLLACQRYIELNPVRANMLAHPAEYKWSSYMANAQGAANVVIKPHLLYNALGENAVKRQAAYRELFRYELDIGLVDEIRKATNSNYALGNEVFVKQVEAALGRRASQGKSGRPKIEKNSLESHQLW
jgi:putative transposase